MTNTNERVEQREHKRFQVCTGAFVGLGPHYDRVGPILDISMGGLSFRHIGKKKLTNGSYLDIFLTEANFYLGKVPINPILDCEIADKPPSSSVTIRRYEVKFGKLTDNQRSQIEFFIKNYTVGQASA